MNGKQLGKPSISFFCPAYNDQDNLPILIPKVIALLKKVSRRFEVLIIDDASPDNTGEVAEKLAKKYKPYIRVVHHKKNRDYGGALRSGFAHSGKFEYIFYTDGDNQYNVNELKRMLTFVPKYDAVLAYRRNRSITAARIVQSYAYNWLIRTLFGIQVKDVGCALRLIKKPYLSKIRFTTNSAFVQAEVILGLKKQNASIKQISVTHYQRKFGKASGGNPRVILHTITDILKVYTKNGISI